MVTTERARQTSAAAIVNLFARVNAQLIDAESGAHLWADRDAKAIDGLLQNPLNEIALDGRVNQLRTDERRT